MRGNGSPNRPAAQFTQVTQAGFASLEITKDPEPGVYQVFNANNHEEGPMDERQAGWIGHVLGYIEVP